jgi:uncharacterized repeat protein (TIGR01451 family)
MKKLFTLFSLFASISAFALDASHFTITRITAPYFIVDGNSPTTITGAYVGFEVKNNNNSGVTYTGLKFTITSITSSVSGQNYSVISPASGIVNAGTLAPGQSKVCYYYVSYPANVTPQATFNVSLSDTTATPKNQSFIIRNRSSISANAGGTATQSFTNQDLIGGIITDDVTYVVGNVQNGDENDFQVAVSPQFDPTKIILLGTSVTSSSVPGITVGTTDSLYFISGNGSNGAAVTIRWTFRIAAVNFTNYLLPCAGATSGNTNYKYALNSSLGQGTPVVITNNANPLTITKKSDRAVYLINSPAIFTVTIRNPSAFGITIDKITDELPAGFTFLNIEAASNVTVTNSTTKPVAGATGILTFEGGVTTGNNISYFVPANDSIILQYKATSRPNAANNLVTTARDYVGATEVGSAQNTVSVATVLALNWLTQNAYININKQAVLNWKVQETNVARYEIEKSNDGRSFISIATLSSKGNGENNYIYTDATTLQGLWYFRIKQIDKDEKYSYSSVFKLSNQQAGTLSVYPNPVKNILTINNPIAGSKIMLSSTDGKLLQIISVSSPSFTIDMSKYASGLYTLNNNIECFSGRCYFAAAFF